MDAKRNSCPKAWMVVAAGTAAFCASGLPARTVQASTDMMLASSLREDTTVRDDRPVSEGGGLKYFGFNYASWWNGTFATPASTRAIEHLAATGANLVAICPTQYQSDVRSDAIHRTQATESDGNIIRAIRDAKANGLIVMLKPHLDVSDTSFRGAIDAANPQKWFAHYSDMIIHYARIAQRENVELFSIGTELMGMTRPEYTNQWRRLIADVRAVYGGKLTYAANWGEEKHVRFWDELDYIGVDFYAPLTEISDPSFEQLVDAWIGYPQHRFSAELYEGKSIFRHHQDLAAQWGKPLIFTEIGFRSVDGANIQFSNPASAKTEDLQEQTDLYRSLMEAVNRTGADAWLHGVIFWNWEPVDMARTDAIDPFDFTPQTKPALAVIRSWFHHLSEAQGRTPPIFAPIAAVFELREDWPHEFWGDIHIRNISPEPQTNWTLTVVLPGASRIRDIWGVEVIAQDGQTVTLAPSEDWSRNIQPGVAIKAGLTLTDAGGASRKLDFQVR